MKINYSQHLINRLLLRRIEYGLPKRIFDLSTERYFDGYTGHSVAVMRVDLYEGIREVMVAYYIENDDVTLLTVHPLKQGQKENRIKSGRWREL